MNNEVMQSSAEHSFISDRERKVLEQVRVFTEIDDEAKERRQCEVFVRGIQAGNQGEGVAALRFAADYTPRLTRIVPVYYEAKDEVSTKRQQRMKETLLNAQESVACHVLPSVDEGVMFQARSDDGEMGFLLSGNSSERFASVGAMFAHYTAVEIAEPEYTEADYFDVMQDMMGMWDMGWTEEQIATVFPGEYWQCVKDNPQVRELIEFSQSARESSDR